MSHKKLLTKALSLLLLLSMLLSLFPTALAQEAQSLAEEKNDTKDIRNSNYVFLDFKVGSASRNFGWQVQTDSTSTSYFAANDQGLFAGYYSGDDPRLYMPIETTDSGLERLGGYVLKAGDIIQARVYDISENTYFTTNGTRSYNSGFSLRNSLDPNAWDWVGTTKIKGSAEGQTLQWSVPADQVDSTLYGVRWDPIQPTSAEKGTFTEQTRIYLDYIYVGPASSAPVNVQYYDTDGTLFSHANGYVGKGQKAPAWAHGKTNTSDGTYATIWGWEVQQYIGNAWTVSRAFVTDPTTVVCNYDTKFLLKRTVVPVDDRGLYSGKFSGGLESYTLTMSATSPSLLSSAELNIPTDVTIIMDRSGSMDELVSKKTINSEDELNSVLNTLDKRKWAGYYRASAWSRGKNNGTSGAAGYIYTMPMRYHNDQWQMQVVTEDCDCNGKYSHYNYGIYYFNSTALTPCSHVKWVKMSEGYALFKKFCKADGYSTNFTLGISALGRSQLIAEDILQELYKSNTKLPAGQSHRVSVLGYGATVFAKGYPYWDGVDDYKMQRTDLGCSQEIAELDKTNYEKILKTIRNTYVYGASHAEYALQTLTGAISDIEKSAGCSSAVLNNTAYLPKKTADRNRIIVLVSDGLVTASLDFDNSVATKAIAAAKILKNSGVKIYTAGVGTSLDSSKYYTSSYATGTQAQKSNNFLNLISSRYPSAGAYNNAGSKTVGDYYISGTVAGEDIAASILRNTNTDPYASVSAQPLYLHQEISPYFIPEENYLVKIYASPYNGSGSFGSKELIGQHTLHPGTTELNVSGEGYTLLSTLKEDGSRSLDLLWADASNAYSREVAFAMGAYPQYTKGYRIELAIDLAVNRNLTLGGEAIPATLEGSGVYTVSGNTMGSCIEAFEPIFADVDVLSARVANRSISLLGNIAINFFVDMSPAMANNLQTNVRFFYPTGEVETVYISDPRVAYSELTNYYNFPCEVTAKEMTEEITAQVYFGDIPISEPSTYSVKTYVDRIWNYATDPALTTLLTKMLHYGAASQIYFGNDGTLANEGLEAPDYSNVTIPGYEVNKNQGTSLVRYYGASLILTSETTLRVYLSVDSSVGSDLKISLNGDTLTPTALSAGCYVDVLNIAANELDDVYTLRVSDGKDSADVSYCPLSYCANILRNANGAYNRELQDVAASLYLYNQAANDYFE